MRLDVILVEGNGLNTYGESELDGAEGDDEDAEDDGDGAVANHLGGGAHDAGLPGPHSVPAPRMEERLLQLLRFVPETHCDRFCLFQSPVVVKDQKYLFFFELYSFVEMPHRERERQKGRRVIVIIKKTKEAIIEGTKTKCEVVVV